MLKLLTISVMLMVLSTSLLAQETVRLAATADAGFSSMIYQGEDERVSSWGKHNQFKLKSIQEMGLVRFDASAIKGREVKKATLFLRNVSDKNRIRTLRISTVNNDWVEGTATKPYGPPNGACYNYADWNSKKEWAWPNSQLCDVILSSGFSLSTWAERKKLDDGWMSFELPAELMYAMYLGDTDGLAFQDAGDLTYSNNFIYSREKKGSEPYIQIELGDALTVKPSTPVVKVTPGNEVATFTHGAVKVHIAASQNTFCWKIKANGENVGRWQVPHPKKNQDTEFFIEYLEPGKQYDIEIIAVSAGGQVSKVVKQSTVASKKLASAQSLGTFQAPTGKITPLKLGSAYNVWACPGLVKVSPETGKVMFNDMVAEDGHRANAVWDGKKISLLACKGEYVSCQLIIEKNDTHVSDIQVSLKELNGVDGAVIKETEIELYKNWYAKNKDKNWQPAYCVPLKHGAHFRIPDPLRKMASQKNQGIYIDIYVPKDTQAGDYTGKATISANGQHLEVPVELQVFDFVMPDKLSFWPQLNSYGFGMDKKLLIPTYQLAHQHRNVFFHRSYIPKLTGKGKDIKVDWTSYDKQVGPLLSGEAFKNNRRAGVPTPALGLPFKDSWPTNLTPETYKYDGRWILTSYKSDKRDKKELMGYLNEHYMTCPPIEEGLTQEYKDAFVAVQKQFIEHFKEKGWDHTEAQCLFMGKNTHRIQYKVNMWWTTDEPYHWIDWLAIRFFGTMWVENRGAENAKNWVFRSDISRPQWQGNIIDGLVDNIHFGTGAFTSPAMYRRAELIERNSGADKRVYGAANRDNSSNHGSITWFANSWFRGANAALPWQAMGKEKALDINDSAVGGNAMIVPAQKTLGVPVVADIRLKAFRDGEQLIEYLTLFAERYDLTREQVREVVFRSVTFEAGIAKGAGADNADALRFKTLQSWQLAQLKKALAEAIVARN